MQKSTRSAWTVQAAVLIWLAALLTATATWAQVRPPAPEPKPPVGSGESQLVGDGSEIDPLALATVAGGQPATFERAVEVQRISDKVLVATCVSVKLRPKPEKVDATLTGTISPKRQARRCADGEILTCAPGEQSECGKYTVTIGSRFETPPRTYRFDLFSQCASCTPMEANVGAVRLAIAKPKVEVSASPSSLIVPAGNTATYNIVVKRTGYLGPITLNLAVPAALQDAELAPRLIPASTNPDAQHSAALVVKTKAGSTGTPPGTYSFTVMPSLVAPDADKIPATVALTVLGSPPSEGLAIAIEPGSQEARLASCARYQLKVTPTNFPANFQGSVNLRLAQSNPPLPASMSVRFAPAAVPITEASLEAPAELQIEIPPDAEPKTYRLTVEGSVTVNNRTVTAQQTATLEVLAAPPRLTLRTNLAANPQVAPGGTTNFLIFLERGAVPGCSPGYSGEVELTTNDPVDLTHEFTLQPGPGDLAQLEITAKPEAQNGDPDYVIGGNSDDYEIAPLTVKIEVRRLPIVVFSPAAGSMLVGGQSAIASWTIPGSTAAIQTQDILISLDNGAWRDLGRNRPAGERSLPFTVPLPVASSEPAVVRVIARNSAGQVVNQGDSGQFTITRPAPVPPPTGNLTASPTSLSFSAVPGGASPAPRNVTIGSTGSALDWSAMENAPWLTLSPTSGTTPGSLTASVNIAGLVPGTYSATITLTASGSANVTVPVSLTLTSPPPPPAGSLVVSPSSLGFTAPQGGPAPAVQVLQIGSTAAPLNWSVSDNAAFVNLSPAAGVTPGATNVSINVGGLAAGSYSAAITVTAPGAAPLTVPVSLTITSVGTGTPVVNGFLPFSGSPGALVEVIGANFVGVTQVQFNNTPAQFQPNSDTRLFATVPNGATTGPIRVTNASGTGASFTPFTVTPAGGGPSIALFSPLSGAPGDRITIQGANFQNPSQVFFNGKPSPFVLFAGPNFLSAEVPLGATTGPIQVTTSAGSATSTQSFVVTTPSP